MLNPNLLHGPRVVLCADLPETTSRSHSRWDRDSAYMRFSFLGAGPLLSPKFIQGQIEKQEAASDAPDEVIFTIRTRADDRPIGSVELSGISWQHGNAFLGIGIGERADWGQGYGTEAIRLILDYAFRELGLHRVTLEVFDYNPRAIHVYEHLGFRHEGRKRELGLREGRRFDVFNMGILRREWEAQQPAFTGE